MTEPIDLEQIAKAVYSFLDKEGFMFEQMADWERFNDASKPHSGIKVEEVYNSSKNTAGFLLNFNFDKK